jgi:transketolase
MIMPQNTHMDKVKEAQRLALIATRIRAMSINYITKSGSGHPGGSLSIADILACLYFGRVHDPASGGWVPVMRYDPDDALWLGRDRFILSKGHAAPAYYAVLSEAGFIDKEAFEIYRKIECPLEGHPVMCRMWTEDDQVVEKGISGVDFAAGSLGHGLSAAAGMALHAKIYGYNYQVFAMLGDGDLQEGMTWEACLTIPNKNLNNVCAWVDYNRLQVDGSTEDINSLFPLADKFSAFGWKVVEIDGHDIYAIMNTLAAFKTTRSSEARPMMVIANTIKGKGVPEIEGNYVYHAVPLSVEQNKRAQAAFEAKIEVLTKELGKKEIHPDKSFSKEEPPPLDQDLDEIIARNPCPDYTEPTATRLGYGSGLARLGEYRQIVVLNADLAGACGVNDFVSKYPENAAESGMRRSINVGVQECNMMTMGAALASCGKIPFVNSFGIFSTGRAWEMVRQDISYPNLNVKIIGSHTGIALGEYGVTHQSTEDVALMAVLPNLTVIEPSDAIQADLLTEQIIQYQGPIYLRLGRNPTPLIYGKDNPWQVEPIRDFEIGKGYEIKQGTDITLIASGPIICQALEAARRVKQSVRVVDMPTVHPADQAIILKAAEETGHICTVQDHLENGGLNDAVGRILLKNGVKVRFDYIALSGYAESGSVDDLYEKYGLSANRIIEKLGLTLND